MLLSSFHLSVGHLYVICREISIWYFAHFETELFVSLLLSFRSNLCILHTNLLSDMFATLSSHSISYLFFYWLCPLLCRSSLVRCNLTCLVFAFVFCTWHSIQKYHCQHQHQAASSLFSPRRLMVSILCLNFQLIFSLFLRVVWHMNPISFFHMWLSSFQNTCFIWNWLPFAHYSCHSFENQWATYMWV